MSRCRLHMPVASQRGLTLVELLISITIGLLVTVASASLYLVARQGFSTSDDQSRTFETSRLVVDQLSRNLRMAGAPFFDPADLSVASGGIVTLTIDAIFGREGGGELPDAFAIAYTNIDAYDPATLMGADCQGQAIAGGPRAVVINSFFVVSLPASPSGAARAVLACVGNGPTSAGPTPATSTVLADALLSDAFEPIADQVVDMQVTYGLASETSPGSTVRTGIKADAVAASDWRFVRSADICLEIVSQANRTLTGAMPGSNCHGKAFPADGRLHRIFRFTVNRRNETVGDIL